MATTPSTIIIKSTSLSLPTQMLFVVCKQLFIYGVKSISEKDGQIIINLSYTPKAPTLQHKFGNLPVSYIKLHVDSKQELQVFKEALKRFSFNINTEVDDEVDFMLESSAGLKSVADTSVRCAEKKKKMPKVLVIPDTDEDEEEERKMVLVVPNNTDDDDDDDGVMYEDEAPVFKKKKRCFRLCIICRKQGARIVSKMRQHTCNGLRHNLDWDQSII